MIGVLRNTWALLLGMFLLQLGNGMQGTALGLRGGLEGYSSTIMGYVMMGYFLGFLGGARATPWLLRRVGHVRVFAALASLISAAFIIYAAWVDPFAWFLMRVLVGFCFSGVYVVAESWLNDGIDNSKRGQALSAYLIVQMGGIVLSQAMINVASPGGYELFVIMSIAVSIAVTPILLSVSPVPMFEMTRRMSLVQLFHSSPLGLVGTFLLGATFACLFGMASVYSIRIGFSTEETAIYVGTIYLGGLLCQYPIGWLSDRMDRRVLIVATTGIGTMAALAVPLAGVSFELLVASGFIIGGVANPLYSLLLAHTNDFLEHEDMASAASGLVALNGIGAVGTPVLVGYLMDAFGPDSFLWVVALTLGLISVYGLYRMTARASTPVEDTLPSMPLTMTTTSIAAEVAQEVSFEQAVSESDEDIAESQEKEHA
ncbi:MFS transporter [Rhodobacteraceae bacterium NNCM2]|nr:MFS transporter [Coraliihabitans acroporae]